LLKLKKSQKPPDIIERFELWAEADLFRTTFPMILKKITINGGDAS
jgi:hypothetical protein